jgi:hypothetical protein
MRGGMLYRLTWLALGCRLAAMGHLIRGNAVGWPVTDQVSTTRRRGWPSRRLGSPIRNPPGFNGSSRWSDRSLNLGAAAC